MRLTEIIHTNAECLFSSGAFGVLEKIWSMLDILVMGPDELMMTGLVVSWYDHWNRL